MLNFPDDYFIEPLRGSRQPQPSTVRHVLAQRAAWLVQQIARIVRERSGATALSAKLLSELAAIALVIETYERIYPRAPLEERIPTGPQKATVLPRGMLHDVCRARIGSCASVVGRYERLLADGWRATRWEHPVQGTEELADDDTWKAVPRT